MFTAPRGGRGRSPGEAVILVRPFTEADDVAGFHAAVGILTSEGGKASHAALVARGMGRPAVTGASSIEVNLRTGEVRVRRLAAARRRLHRDRRLDRPVTTDDVPLIEGQIDAQLREGPASGPTSCATSACAPMPTRPRTPSARVEFGAAGHRPVPHRAHVHGGRPPAEDARDDHGRRRRGPQGRARRAAAAAAGRLRGPVRGDGRPPGHDPAARPAAARVPAVRDRSARGDRQGAVRERQARPTTSSASSRSCARSPRRTRCSARAASASG